MNRAPCEPETKPNQPEAPPLSFEGSAHLDAKIEWWFIHGRFAGEEVEERYFLVSLFRLRLPDKASGFVALISVLDPRAARHSTSSRVDQSIVEMAGQPGVPGTVDPFSSPAHDELQRFGLPREFECPAAVPEFCGDPLSVQWADLTLASRAGGVDLSFHEPGTSRPLDLKLIVETSRLTIDAARASGELGAAMHYMTYPHLRLTGSAGGCAVEGEAWLDQQWGGSAWFRGPDSPPRARGWDWLGFSLDDGTVWVVGKHWEGASSREFARHLTMFEPSGVVHESRTFEFEPLRWWTSLATRITHPVEWRLRVPEWDTDLVFVPFADDQEIRVFGPMRAIWEGAGRVQGRFRGRPVEALARLEGQGRGYVFEIAEYLHGWARLVDRELVKFLPQAIEEKDVHRYAGPPTWIHEPCSYTAMLSEPLWDLMSRGGKRWRAVFFYLLLDALGRDPEPLLDVTFVLPELPHNASLIIDDIQDGSSLRRGAETIHRRYGVDVAISAANTAYFLPLLLVLDHSVLTKDEKQAICESYQRSFIRAHLGQSLDLFWARKLNAEQLEGWMADSIGPKILQTYALKTAALIEGLAETAAMLARAGDGTRLAVMELARSFGLAFQLIDDVKDFCYTPGWGKPRGEDLRTGKLTYLLLCALNRLAPPGRALLRDILCRPELRSDPDVLARGIELVVNSGACEQVRREARALMLPAWETFSRHVPASTSKTELRFLWESLVGLAGGGQDRSQS
jgi:geranylgeranyl pyrophosphate synthase/predicted secreted hydrolase